jgi:uncharacterized membrane protein YcgQ (UPF0703/DUF1980 family)
MDHEILHTIATLAISHYGILVVFLLLSSQLLFKIAPYIQILKIIDVSHLPQSPCLRAIHQTLLTPKLTIIDEWWGYHFIKS